MARGLAAYSCGGSPGVSPEFPFHLLAENLSQGGFRAKVGWGSMWGVEAGQCQGRRRVTPRNPFL